MINNIQILRAFAAVNVILYHIIGASKLHAQDVEWLKNFQHWGASGVDIFFTISGFVMLHTQMMRKRSPGEFFRDRLVRIVPIYWLLTLFIALLFVVWPAIFKNTVATPSWVISSLLFTSSLFPGRPPLIAIGWTLEWEMFFYLAFAFGLLFKNLGAQLAFVATVLIATSIFAGNSILIEFLLGMLIAYIYAKVGATHTNGLACAAVGGFLLLLSLSPDVVNLNLDRVLLWGIPSFFIVYGLICCAQIKNRLLMYLGNASYSIYLAQALTIPAFFKFSKRLLNDWNGDLLAILCLILSVVCGCLIFTLIEKPINGVLKKAFVS